ncbi:MvdC/MvdD family ATP grasp protein [Spirillospora sp. CA-294931]|uniref:MvdC/MvdD family ATP grasp protein n=1 Tax=Spirillospora sp. CA-294931 TaxID=3240042 RepID=UPI003D8B3E7C
MTTSAPRVLVLTQEFDPTVDPVVTTLAERGAEVVRADLSYFPRRMTVTTSDFGTTRRTLRLRDRDGDGVREIDLDRLSSVWYRRPTGFDFGPDMAEPEKQFARREAMQGVGGVLRATNCLWVNRPDVDAVGELKPYQLELAKRLGLRVPRTLLTNDPAELAALLADADRPIAYKAFTGGVIHYPGAFPAGLLTTVVGEEIHEHLDRVGHTMCMFQEYVDKAYEVRLTVMGNTYFPVTIESQERDTTRVDWRGESAEMPYGPYRPLPEEVVKKTQALLTELGAVYAALDFIVTPAGEYVFLEVNPMGQFMWMQHDMDLPLGDHLADLLMKGGPFARGEVTQVGY